MRSLVWFAASGLALVGCAQPGPERQVVDGAAAAVGGQERIAAVSTLVVRGRGETFNLGQNKNPESALPRFEVSEFTRALDFVAGRWRHEQVITPRYLTRNTATRTQAFAFDGDVVFDVAPSGTAARVSGAVAAVRRAQLRRSPLGILKLGLSEGVTLSQARTAGDREVVDISTPEGDSFTLSIDATTKLPATVTSMGYHPYLGDVALESEFSDYVESDGLMLPTHVVERVDNTVVADLRVSEVVIDGETEDLTAPSDVREASGTPPAATVTVEEVAPGTWYLAGQSHHSVVVEFEDHLTLIEAPQNDVRALAVIARARELADKPLTHLVVTHHHFDHSGGVRAAVSEGLTLIVHEASGGFYETLAARQHGVHADALASNPQPLQVDTVSDQLELTDARRTVVLYPITDSPHADTLLMVYFPSERLLVEADVFTPPAPDATTPQAYPFVENLLENIRSRDLDVDRLLPIHGRIVPFSDLVEVAESIASAPE